MAGKSRLPAGEFTTASAMRFASRSAGASTAPTVSPYGAVKPEEGISMDSDGDGRVNGRRALLPTLDFDGFWWSLAKLIWTTISC
jgi:hypothetical protein